MVTVELVERRGPQDLVTPRRVAVEQVFCACVSVRLCFREFVEVIGRPVPNVSLVDCEKKKEGRELLSLRETIMTT